jgi:vanillate O-demethylase ferredoxin subunit
MRSDNAWTEGSIRAIRDLTPTIRMFEIAPESGGAVWNPGSHINVGVTVDGRADSRSYSLVGEPGGGVYRIAVKRDDSGRGGSCAMHRLRQGMRVSLSSPQNNFDLEFDRPDYLLVAGGIGITPMLGMAQALKKRGASFRFVYCARSRDELALLPELPAICGEALSVFVSDEGQRLDLAREIATLDPEGQLYLCGPMRLLDDARRVWSEAGRAPSGLRYETFGSSGRFAPQAFVVRTVPEGLEIPVPENKTMLDALIEAGIDVMYDCKRGECGLCALNVLESSGSIDHRDVFFSERERAENHKICACVSRAVGGVLTVDTAYRGKAAA